MINKRLEAITTLIDKGSIVIDIGTDHAYLPLMLVEKNISNKVYAVDNKIEPLNNAKKTIKENHMEDKIIPILSNGFIDVRVDDFNVVTISGMGGITIREILKDLPKSNLELILEPNKNQLELREYLMNNNFKIIDEIMIYDQKVYYPIIKAKKVDEKISYKKEELEFGPIILNKRPKEFVDFIKLKINILKSGLSQAKNKDELKEKINYLEDLIDESRTNNK